MMSDHPGHEMNVRLGIGLAGAVGPRLGDGGRAAWRHRRGLGCRGGLNRSLFGAATGAASEQGGSGRKETSKTGWRQCHVERVLERQLSKGTYQTARRMRQSEEVKWSTRNPCLNLPARRKRWRSLSRTVTRPGRAGSSPDILS